TNGKINYSEVKAINLSLSNNQVNVYPNPIINQLTIRIPSAHVKNIHAGLYSFNGKLIESTRLKVENGETQWTLAQQPAAGTYILQLDGDVKYSQKVIVQ